MTSVCPNRRKTKKLELTAEADVDSIMIAQDIRYPGNETISKCYAVYPITKVEKLIDSDLCLYDMVQANTPVAMFLDIEWEEDGEPTDGGNRLGKILGAVEDSIVALLGIDEPKYYLLRASRRKGDKYKHSYHAHYPSLVFKNIRILHSFMFKLLERVYGFPLDKHFLFAEEKPVIDCGVYNKWRPFRLPNQSGLDKHCPLDPLDCCAGMDIHNYLINKPLHTVEFDEVPGCKLSKAILKKFANAPKHDEPASSQSRGVKAGASPLPTDQREPPVCTNFSNRNSQTEKKQFLYQPLLREARMMYG